MSAIRNLCLSALLLMLVVAGCSKSELQLAPVSGRVTLDGQPLSNADVYFQPEGKSPGIGRTDEDGRYEMAYKRGVMGAPIGPNTVRIAVNRERAHGPQTVPPRYNTESELQREVKPGQNVFDFELTTAAK